MTSNPVILDELITAEATHTEAHRGDPPPTGTPGRRPNQAKSVMLSLRLNPDELTAVHALAREHNVPASALVRGWILQHLAHHDSTPTNTTDAVDRLEADVRALRRLVAS
jgi:transposase-like protein